MERLNPWLKRAELPTTKKKKKAKIYCRAYRRWVWNHSCYYSGSAVSRPTRNRWGLSFWIPFFHMPSTRFINYSNWLGESNVDPAWVPNASNKTKVAVMDDVLHGCPFSTVIINLFYSLQQWNKIQALAYINALSITSGAHSRSL